MRIWDVDPGIQILLYSNPDPRSNNNKKEREKICYLSSEKNYNKVENYIIFEKIKKKFEPILTKNYRSIFFAQKIVSRLKQIWVWETYPGFRGQTAPDPGSGSATLSAAKYFDEYTV